MLYAVGRFATRARSACPGNLSSRLVLLLAVAFMAAPAWAVDARDIVRDAIDHWRGSASSGEMTMIIHRPDWERSMTMESWTQGSKQSLVRVIEPDKDRGNGTLMVDNSMWNYSPKVNRVVKVPSSMMGQSWMGSDFSNKDVSRADEFVERYPHQMASTTVRAKARFLSRGQRPSKSRIVFAVMPLGEKTTA